MTTEQKTLAKTEPKQTPADLAVLEIMETLRRREARLELLLPPKSDVSRFKESVRFALAQQPALVKCTPQSLVLAVMRGARTGLPVDGGGGLAWIVPYGTEATYVPGYKGLITLAKATGLVKDMQPKAVHAADAFEVDEADGKVTHKRFIPRTKDDDRGPLIAVYCRTTLPDGTVRFTVMDMMDIERIRSKSRAQNGPWKTDFEAMALKSVVKMDFKTLGVPPGDTFKALRIALAADTAAESGEVDSELREVEERTRPSANDELRAKLRRREEEQAPAAAAPGEMTEAEKSAAMDAEWNAAVRDGENL